MAAKIWNSSSCRHMQSWYKHKSDPKYLWLCDGLMILHWHIANWRFFKICFWNVQSTTKSDIHTKRKKRNKFAVGFTLYIKISNVDLFQIIRKNILTTIQNIIARTLLWICLCYKTIDVRAKIMIYVMHFASLIKWRKYLPANPWS